MNPIPWQPVDLGVEAGIGAVYLVRPSSGMVYAAERLQPNGDGVSLLADEDGDMLGGVTFRRMQDKLRARILSNEAGHITGTLGRPMGAPGIECESRAFWYPKPLLLVALAALAFAATGASGATAGPDRITAQARRSCSANSARHHVHYRASSLDWACRAASGNH